MTMHRDKTLCQPVASFVTKGILVLLGFATAVPGHATVIPGQLFGSPTVTAMGAAYTYVASGDLNGDRLPEIVATCEGTDTLVVLLNSTSGFMPPVSYPTPDAPQGVALGDIDGDGDIDVVACSFGPFGGPSQVSVWKNDGTGTLGLRVDYPTDYSARALVLHDLDGDGRLDLAFTRQGAPNEARVRLNDGTGAFGVEAAHAVGSGAIYIAAADLNRDGRTDLVTADYIADSLTVLLGIGGGDFAPGVSIPTANYPTTAVPVLLNGDNYPDLIVVGDDSNDFRVLINDGTGIGFTETAYPTATPSPDYCAVGDYDGDCDPDVAIATRDGGNPIEVYRNSGGGAFVFDAAYSCGGIRPGTITTADLDLDGDLDLVAGAYYAGSISVLKNITGEPATRRCRNLAEHPLVVLPAFADWTTTGVSVQAGDSISIRVEGLINVGGASELHRWVGPDGVTPQPCCSPYGSFNRWSVVGQVGSGPVFFVGSHIGLEPGEIYVAPASGDLKLRINDDVLWDNTGQFLVVIRTKPAMVTKTNVLRLPLIAFDPASDWMDTGLLLLQGDTLGVHAEGLVFVGGAGPMELHRWVTPDGVLPQPCCSPYGTLNRWSLVGRISTNPGAVFQIGRHLGTTPGDGYIVPQTGVLQVRLNDDVLGDNIGRFVVEITLHTACCAPGAVVTGVETGPPPQQPGGFSFAAPNPSTGSARIYGSLASDGPGTLDVFDLRGARVAHRILDSSDAGAQWIAEWDGLNDSGRGAPAGVYLYRVRRGEAVATGRVVISK